MIELFNKVNDLSDLHCHIVPYADDGVEDFETAREMIIKEYSQGVRSIVATPHLRYGMFDTPGNAIQKHLTELGKWLDKTNMNDLALFISREYYCDERLLVLLDGFISGKNEVYYDGQCYIPKEEILPFGKHRCVLLEFSSNRIQTDEFAEYINRTVEIGLTPIIAHVERYPAVQENPSIVGRMKEIGAYIQVNCESVLTRNKSVEGTTTDILIKQELVDVAASDSHDLNWRLPNIKRGYSHLKRVYGKDIADKLLRLNAQFLIFDR